MDGLSWTVIAEKVTDASSDRFTADQCRIKWVGNRHPDIDHTEWSKTETKDLLALLEEKKKGDDDNDPVDWVKVAKELGVCLTIIWLTAYRQVVSCNLTRGTLDESNAHGRDEPWCNKKETHMGHHLRPTPPPRRRAARIKQLEHR